ncbi:MAG: hypothetical protein A2X82_11715 [Geobacteraceae bacterium GWC2_55_20]|nr:MAG: hypothetical protein A2X82_11715 [Geobacteraceae bacterium GWC2_55_20]OGU23337.1 MAG: hypothetical protein A2X85_17700 [Geobacteraceae bacterium GWF2_54_21]
MPSAIEHYTCTSAEDMLDKLRPANELWQSTRQFWAFRGLWNDDFTLIPSALRSSPEAKLGYTFAPKKGIQPTNQEQINAEFRRLHEFYWSIDAQGLLAPVDSNLLRTPKGWLNLEKKITNHGWPVDELLPLLALAQHYGVHTRLLDWSDKPLVAAYFAAKKAVEKTSGRFLSVWALNLDWVVNTAFPGNLNTSVYIVTAPHASNPNLHAQGGIFTTEMITRAAFPKPVNCKPVNVLIEKEWKTLHCTDPVMGHFKLPCSEANKLLRLLNQEGINAATIYPGYKGVADSLTERELWDIPERATYWMK